MRMGYRIISVDAGSPIASHNVEPMLDFIVYPDSGVQAGEETSFEEFLGKNENRQIDITLYNIATRRVRKIQIVPKKWSGNGLLGATIRLEDFANAHTRVMRVLNIYLNSPLHHAGLQPKKDYILGTEKHCLQSGEFRPIRV